MRFLSRPLSRIEVGLLLVAVILRLYLVYHRGVLWTADATSYDSAALTFAQEGTLLAPSLAESFDLSPALKAASPRLVPLNDFAIGFSVYIAFFYKFFSEDHAVMIAMLSLAFFAATILPIASRELFLRLFKKQNQSYWHVAVMGSIAFWPGSLEMSNYYLSENLTVVVLTLWVLGSVILMQSMPLRLRWHMLWALFTGFLFLTRVEYGIAMALTYLWVYGRALLSSKKENLYHARLRQAVGTGAVLFCFFVTPSVRNYYHFQEFIPATAGGSFALWHAYLQSGDANFRGEYKPILENAYVPGKPGATDANLTAITMKGIKAEPLHFLQGMARRIYRVHFHAFGEPPLQGQGPLVWFKKLMIRGSHVAAAFLFIFSLFKFWQPAMFPIVAVYVTKFLIIHTIYHFEPRMFYTFFPVVTAMAIGGLAYLTERRRRSVPNSANKQEWSPPSRLAQGKDRA